MTLDDATPTIGDVLRAAAARHPDRDAYVHGDDRCSYEELDRAADDIAADLRASGVAGGDRVLLVLRNGVALPKWYLGAARAGAITSAVNVRLGAVERADIIARTEPRVVVTEPDITIESGSYTTRLVGDPPTPRSEPVDAVEVAATDPVCIVWTSGTTGTPKGAVFDHVCQAEISRGMGDLAHPGDRRLFVLPMPHVGYMTRVWDDFAKGITTVFAGEPWSAEHTLEIVDAERITMMTGVPTQWQMLLEHPRFDDVDWSALRLCGIGGAAIPPEVVREMRARLGVPVLARYTSTEAGLSTGTRTSDPPEVTATTVGVASVVVELRVVDPTSGETVGQGEVGEIRTRSRAMFRGYWRDPVQSAAALDEDGFLRSGDLGVVGDDGNLRIVGRLKEMYVRGGYNVYPVEVEAALGAHPGVAEVAVVGYPDERLGERGCAFVVPTADVAPPTLDELRAWCAQRIADYKAPDRLEIVESLPLTSVLKVDKQALARRLR